MVDCVEFSPSEFTIAVTLNPLRTVRIGTDFPAFPFRYDLWMAHVTVECHRKRKIKTPSVLLVFTSWPLTPVDVGPTLTSTHTFQTHRRNDFSGHQHTTAANDWSPCVNVSNERRWIMYCRKSLPIPSFLERTSACVPPR